MTINLVDNDIALKICQYNLVSEFSLILNGLESVYLLPTLKYRFFLNDEKKALKRCGNTDTVTRLKEMVTSANEINTPADNTLLAVLSEVDQIDSGEATLFALNATISDSLMLTGDKRSLMALSKAINDQKIPDLYAGRLKCFEQIIAEILLSHDTSHIINKIKGQAWDKALYACFGTSSQSVENIIDGLKSYYNDLNRKCFELLAPFPEQLTQTCQRKNTA